MFGFGKNKKRINELEREKSHLLKELSSNKVDSLVIIDNLFHEKEQIRMELQALYSTLEIKQIENTNLKTINQELVNEKIENLLKNHPFFSRYQKVQFGQYIFHIAEQNTLTVFCLERKPLSEIAMFFLGAEQKHGNPPNKSVEKELMRLQKKETTLETFAELLALPIQFKEKQAATPNELTISEASPSDVQDLQNENAELNKENIELNKKNSQLNNKLDSLTSEVNPKDPFYVFLDDENTDSLRAAFSTIERKVNVLQKYSFTKTTLNLLDLLTKNFPEYKFMTEQPINVFMKANSKCTSENFDATVFGKRLAMFRYDIVVYDSKYNLICMIEVDGSSHDEKSKPIQKKRDDAKNRLTNEIIDVPLVRITNDFINEDKNYESIVKYLTNLFKSPKIFYVKDYTNNQEGIPVFGVIKDDTYSFDPVPTDDFKVIFAESQKKVTQLKCTECNADIHKKLGIHGEFLGCDTFYKHKTIKGTPKLSTL